ncbi:MAG: alkaline phosphatase family protein [Methanocellales archaeon]|nr:alkaline phosphatase family protein [Methanocellales archaeon]
MQARQVVLISLIVCFILPIACAVDVVINPVPSPNGAVLLIVDGFGSCYFYPEFVPHDLDGNELMRGEANNIMLIADGGVRVLDITAPQPRTALGHSVLVTGYSHADPLLVGFDDATIFDATRKHNYLCIGVMQKGDFESLRAKQDGILFDSSNSIKTPTAKLEVNAQVPADVIELMQEWQNDLPSYLDGKEGVERYTAYNRWGIDASDAIARYMCDNHPDRKFLLTVNVGAVDLAGHHMGPERYIELIGELDEDVCNLYLTCLENNLALIITADHGMAFAMTEKGRYVGGHASDKYAGAVESQRIPLIVSSPNIRIGVIDGTYGQEDVAPTLLSILDVPEALQYSDGDIIPVKKYANLRVIAESPIKITLQNNDATLYSITDEDVTFVGLTLGNYTVSTGRRTMSVNLRSDQVIEIETSSYDRTVLAAMMISMIMVGGGLTIRRIMRED